jgi:release factor glutamine methyltransferase
MIRVAGVLAALRGRLGAASPTPALDAEVLVAHVLGASRSAIAAEPERPLAPEEMLALEALVRRRLEGEPVAYLMGRREFWSLELEVTPDVLVPRPETELVVERALAAIASRERPSVLDLGTGSGAIASAIARERPDADVTATDVSAAALAVAARNAARLALPNLRLLEGSWFGPVSDSSFDLIASNPPYVAAGDPALAALAHEPAGALVGGAEGLDALSAIAAAAREHLEPGGTLVLEHGAAQGPAVRALLESAGLVGVGTRRDLAGHERVTEGKRPR